MKTNTKKIIAMASLVLGAVLIIGVLAACGPRNNMGNNDETSSSAHAAEDTGLTVRVFQPQASQAALWETLAADYKTLTGVSVVTNDGRDGTLEHLRETLQAESNATALFFFNNPREYNAWKENALDLAGSEAYLSLLDNRLALKTDAKVVGLPVGVEPFGIICNRTILDNYFALETKTTGFTEIGGITTHAELEALIKDMHAHKADLGIDGVFAAPALKEEQHGVWTHRLLSLPLSHEFHRNNVDLTGESVNEITFQHAEGYRGFYDLMADHGTAAREALAERGYADAAAEFAEGRAAMILGGSEFLGHFNSVPGKIVDAGEIAFLPAFMNYGETEKQGLALEPVLYAAVNAKAPEEERQAALAFLAWLFSSEKGMDFVSNKLNLLAPYSTADEAWLPNNPLSVSAFQWLKRDDVTHIVSLTALSPGEEFRTETVHRHLLGYTRGETPWEEFKDRVVTGWREFRGKIEY
ncbi:MAG: ABC transporter substrate-binding protein [Oscillospiraceae bacterium]|nr:ABC transporter substrate-binding protein [Oscillospiraceae bacterium]